jgi:hypothetical protein
MSQDYVKYFAVDKYNVVYQCDTNRILSVVALHYKISLLEAIDKLAEHDIDNPLQAGDERIWSE